MIEHPIPDIRSAEDLGRALGDYILAMVGPNVFNETHHRRGLSLPPWGTQAADSLVDPRERCKAWMNLANFCLEAENSLGADEYLAQADTARMEIQNPENRDTQTGHLIHFWLGRGTVDKAIEACRTMGWTEKRVGALLSIATHFQENGDSLGAHAFATEAKLAAAACPDWRATFKGLLQIGFHFQRSEDRVNALAHYHEARLTLANTKKPDEWLVKLAQAFDSVGDENTAEALRSEVVDPKTKIDILASQIKLFADRGMREDAKGLLRESIDLALTLRGKKAKGEILGRLASNCFEFGDLSLALGTLQAIEDPTIRLMSLCYLCNVYAQPNGVRRRILDMGKAVLASYPVDYDRSEAQRYIDYLQEALDREPEEDVEVTSFFMEMYTQYPNLSHLPGSEKGTE